MSPHRLRWRVRFGRSHQCEEHAARANAKGAVTAKACRSATPFVTERRVAYSSVFDTLLMLNTPNDDPRRVAERTQRRSDRARTRDGVNTIGKLFTATMDTAELFSRTQFADYMNTLSTYMERCISWIEETHRAKLVIASDLFEKSKSGFDAFNYPSKGASTPK